MRCEGGLVRWVIRKGVGEGREVDCGNLTGYGFLRFVLFYNSIF